MAFPVSLDKCSAIFARDDQRICAITAAMKIGTGLSEFSHLYRERFFDVGIAEEHAVTSAAGMAAAGLKPVVAVYSSFFDRGHMIRSFTMSVSRIFRLCSAWIARAWSEVMGRRTRVFLI